jgi:hypothetical protein
MNLREQRAKVTLCKSVCLQAYHKFVRNPTPQNQRSLGTACTNLVLENDLLANMRTEQAEADHVPALQEVS